MKFSYLIDLYGDVLDDNTREILSSYYYDDLSLAEIAASVGISRQGVRHTIKRGEEQLNFLEEKLSLAKRSTELSLISEELLKISDSVAKHTEDDSLPLSERISDIGKKLVNKGV